MDKEIAQKNGVYVYRYNDNLYINLTNRCTAQCLYCIKYSWEWKFRGCSLKLSKEPSVQDVLKELHRYAGEHVPQIVFCGYGEPLIRLDALKQIAQYAKKACYCVRVNTNGHGNLIHKKNIVPELKNLVDEISISLNASTPEQYLALHRPIFGIQTFDAILAFASECKNIIPAVTLTAIDLPDRWQPGMKGIDVESCRSIADRLGVAFRVRPYLSTYENS